MHVPNESVGLVIGKQGATIKMLEGTSGARVQIAKECPPGSNMRPITVTGQPHAVEHAKSLIMGKVSGVRFSVDVMCCWFLEWLPLAFLFCVSPGTSTLWSRSNCKGVCSR